MQKWEYLKVELNYDDNGIKIWPPDTFDEDWLFEFVGQFIEIKRRSFHVYGGWLAISPAYLSANHKAGKGIGMAAAFLKYLGEQGWEAIEDRRRVMTFKRPIEDEVS